MVESHECRPVGVSGPLIYCDEILGCHWLRQCWLSFHTGEASGTHRGSDLHSDHGMVGTRTMEWSATVFKLVPGTRSA